LKNPLSPLGREAAPIGRGRGRGRGSRAGKKQPLFRLNAVEKSSKERSKGLLVKRAASRSLAVEKATRPVPLPTGAGKKQGRGFLAVEKALPPFGKGKGRGRGKGKREMKFNYSLALSLSSQTSVHSVL
jgi:hypothetical protein